MSSRGWVKLHRQIKEHWTYQEERTFSRFEAWIDLIMRANHKDNKILLGNELIEVKRGQFITSELKLMESWKWGKSKTRNFLKLLEEDGMIVKNSDRKKTTITICNYSVYHESEIKNRPQADHEQTASRLSADTDKNVKECTKKDIYTIFDFWNEQGIIKHRQINKKMESHINARLDNYSIDELKIAISNFKEILDSNEYYWTHKWSLQDFMKPNNVTRFVEEAKPFENFRVSKNKNVNQVRKAAIFDA